MLELYCIAGAWESCLHTKHGHGNSFPLFFGTAYSLSSLYSFCICFRFTKCGDFGRVSFSFSNPDCFNFLIYGISAEKYQEMFEHMNLLSPKLWQVR